MERDGEGGGQALLKSRADLDRARALVWAVHRLCAEDTSCTSWGSRLGAAVPPRHAPDDPSGAGAAGAAGTEDIIGGRDDKGSRRREVAPIIWSR